MKRLILIITSCLIALLPLVGCDKGAEKEDDVLTICNWEDYIFIDEESDDERSLVDDFIDYYKEKTGKTVTVNYTTAGTPEIVYNNLKINEGAYDLICPSDYMIQKMIAEDMLEKIAPTPEEALAAVPNYDLYGSPFLKDLFAKYGWTEYSVPYMWGTMGFVYNPDKVSVEDAESWNCVLMDKYENKTTIKDSVRDTYFLGVALANLSELTVKNAAFEKGELTLADYQSYLSKTFNDTTESTVDRVEGFLKEAKEKAFALEVDAGKGDIATGKIWINFAWSGDAVFAMDDAEGLYAEEGADITPTILNYAVPKEGSNIWFDGWVMPKGANKKLAIEFLDFISSPESAIKNMDYIGYTSAIAGEEVFARAQEYAAGYEDVPENYGEENTVDLSYFFEGTVEGDCKVYVAERGRQFDAQYPSKQIIDRCTIMEHFDEKANARVNDMWNRVKTGGLVTDIIIIVSVISAVAIAYLIMVMARKGIFRKRPLKGYKRIY